MGRLTRHAPSRAMVVSSLALFVALGGTGYAAIVLPRNSVGSAQIKPRAVAAIDIAANAVTSAKIKNGSLEEEDFQRGQLPTAAAGPEAYVSPPFASSDVLPSGGLTGTETVIHALRLPAGNYTIAVSAVVYNGAPSTPLLTICNLREGATPTGAVLGSATARGAPDPAFAAATLAISSATRIPAGGGAVNLACFASAVNEIQSGRIVATKVATLTPVA